ncbi:hypothetical protein M0R19_02210 [Candidatus Pacearchaeota archaeon]|nr:hypothetical protein [Candidatus Pacearchaeota archaeon]
MNYKKALDNVVRECQYKILLNFNTTKSIHHIHNDIATIGAYNEVIKIINKEFGTKYIVDNLYELTNLDKEKLKKLYRKLPLKE